MAVQFNRNTTADDIVAAFPDAVRGRTFVITGPSVGGLGAETAKSLAKGHPAQLVLIGRSASRVDAVIAEVKRISSETRVSFVNADFTRLASVREGADQVRHEVDHIDCLINNAAIMACPQAKSVDGFELQLATNHLAHFVLTNALVDLMSANGGRIVNVSSLGHKFSDIHWDDPNLRMPGAYKPEVAYGQSKTANILHALELSKRLKARDVSVFSVHPGSIATNLQAYVTEDQIQHLISEMKRIDPGWTGRNRKTLQEGSSTTLRAALDPSLTDRSGCYLDDCQISMSEAYASDEAAAEKLWELSAQMTDATVH